MSTTGSGNLRSAFILLVGSISLTAHEVVTTKITWSREISRIFIERCLTCHREGGAAPFAFETYRQTRPWAKAIKEEVLSRRMPPWGAVKGFGDLYPDDSLTQEEVNRVAEWVEGGAPEGDPALLPVMSPRAAKWHPPKHIAVQVRNGFVSSKNLVVLGVQPITDIDRARVFAVKPEGSVEPLIWFRDYKARSRRKFWLRTPMRLPRQSTIRVDGAGKIQLLIATSAPRRAR